MQVQYYEDGFDSDILTVRPIMLVVHTSYNPLNGLNDIAIIRFAAETFPLNNVVSIDFEAQDPSAIGFVAGFGEDSTGTISRIPLRVAQTVVECTDEILESSDSHICASDPNVRMCAGQNGGGLCIETDEKRLLVCDVKWTFTTSSFLINFIFRLELCLVFAVVVYLDSRLDSQAFKVRKASCLCLYCNLVVAVSLL